MIKKDREAKIYSLNTNDSIFDLKTHLKNDGFLPIGIDSDLQLVNYRLSDLDDLLIAGSTGTGKTNFIRNLLISIIKNYNADDVRLYIYGSILVDYSDFNSLSIMHKPVSSSPYDTMAYIYNLKQIALDRQTLFAANRVKNITQYNELVDKLTAESINKNNLTKIPHIVVVLDDYYDIIKIEPNLLGILSKLLIDNRPLGINVILATNSINSDTFSQGFKALLPTRMCFSLSSVGNFTRVLDETFNGALSSPGEFIYKYYNNFSILHSFKPVEDSSIFIKEFNNK